MIEVTRLNGTMLYLNPDLVLFAEATPDTVVSMTNGEKILVKESPAELTEKFIALKRKMMLGEQLTLNE
ncbi:MAG: flagellar FlbD family protein [Vampirovibrionales bacterium]|nr:flagellar FlbD family protein [Vampirovibrionales bacterium]